MNDSYCEIFRVLRAFLAFIGTAAVLVATAIGVQWFCERQAKEKAIEENEEYD